MEECITFKVNKSPAHHRFLQHPGVFLICLYAAGVAIRFLLAVFFRHGPTVQIDESLYINIAKSLAAGEGIAYRAQPVPYLYLFYPLLLAPLYLFPLPFDLYRVVQFYNALLISTSVFPVYCFAKEFTGSRRKALIAAGFTFLMPDLQMTGYLMAESVVWPLALWLIFFAWRMFSREEKRLLSGVITGFLTALLFWAKPGAVAMGLVLLLAALLPGGKPASEKRRSAALAGLTVCTVLVLLFYGLYLYVFGYEFSFLGLYGDRSSEASGVWFAAVSECSLLQLFIFSVACGGLFVVPFACFHRFDRDRKLFFLVFAAGLVVMAVGTAVMVVLPEWNGSFTNPRLHLRYMAMFIPVMAVFALGSSLPSERNPALAFSLAAMAVLTVFPGAFVGFVENDSAQIDSLALSAWLKPGYVPYAAGIVLTVLVATFLILLSLLALRGKLSPAWQKIALLFYAFFLLYNNVCAYYAGNRTSDSAGYGRDAQEMNVVLEQLSGDILIITQPRYDEILSYCLETRIRKSFQQVTETAFMEALLDADGVYAPFFPVDEIPNVGNHITPETGTFLFGITVADHMEFSEAADVRKSQNDWYTLVQVPEGERMVDSLLCGLDMDSLSEEAPARLWILDENRYQKGKAALSLSACAKNRSAELIIENGGRTQKMTLSSDPHSYKFSLFPGETIIRTVGGDAVIFAYSTA